MKYIVVVFVLLNFLFSTPDNIFEENRNENKFSFHSFGLLSYGFHTNTFNLRKAYLKFLYNKKNTQLFFTLKAYKDTHNPAITYNYILNNIELFDYGFNRYFFNTDFFISMRGASGYPKNRETFLIIPHYYSSNNPGEFDTDKHYLKEQIFAPGIRLGYNSKQLLIAYTQGDYRHFIPMSFILKYFIKKFYVRFLIYSYNRNPLIYHGNLYTQDYQLSLFYQKQIYDFIFGVIFEYTYYCYSKYGIIRFEQSIKFHKINLGIREIVNDNKSVFDLSLNFDVDKFLELGLFGSTTGKFYIAGLINF